MKKYIIVFFLFIIGGILIFDYIDYHSQISSAVFDIREYDYYIYNFPSSELYNSVSHEIGLIPNEKIAREKAEIYWISVYGEEIKMQKPYYCFYDTKANTWHITTRKAFRHIWEKNRKGGGTAHMIVQSDGKVLASWRDK